MEKVKKKLDEMGVEVDDMSDNETNQKKRKLEHNTSYLNMSQQAMEKDYELESVIL